MFCQIAREGEKERKGSELAIDTLVSLRLTIVAVSRPLRIQYAGARYHVISRGNRREAIFRDHLDLKNGLSLK